ncbi:nitrogen fixation protein NifQ [uncultured Shewanella sp.]|uniref:nitrogen fixation protein NifQ n=1 Tax=uncultured Shewanella sp. TaxID=173975 RepID=UPI00260FB1FF|nr:nitrogen fixation protein NifQ [uncultured Shewanella sp.]
MDKMAAIYFYIDGLRKNQSHDIPSDLIKFIHLSLTNGKEQIEGARLIQRLRLLDDYWRNMTWEMALNDIKRFSQLIVNNAGPLAFYDDLFALLTAHLSMQDKQQALWWAHKIVIACCGRTHLYIDMGFEERQGITALFNQYFPSFAIKNIDNKMRWKKFLYRQFCLAAQLPLCPTASCSQCSSYQECYSAS